MTNIINVANAPENLFARFLQDDGTYEVSPIVCLGVCDEGGVHYISHSPDGDLYPVTEMSNFHDVMFV